MGLAQLSSANVIMTDSTRILTVHGVITVFLKPLLEKHFPLILFTVSNGFTWGNSQVTLEEVQRGYIFGDPIEINKFTRRMTLENLLSGDDANRLKRTMNGRVVLGC